MEQTQNLIRVVCDQIKRILLKKNECYGDSAVSPLRIFSTANAEEAINVRLDDKLSRLMKGREYQTEDTELDLIGYLILKRVIRRIKNGEHTDDADPPETGAVVRNGWGTSNILERVGRADRDSQLKDRLCEHVKGIERDVIDKKYNECSSPDKDSVLCYKECDGCSHYLPDDQSYNGC